MKAADVDITNEQLNQIEDLILRTQELREINKKIAAEQKLEIESNIIQGRSDSKKEKMRFGGQIFEEGEDGALTAIQSILPEFETIEDKIQSMIGKFLGLTDAILSSGGATREMLDAVDLLAQGLKDSLTAGISASVGAFIDLAIASNLSGKAVAKAAFESSSAVLKALAQEAAVKAIFALAEGLFFKDPKKLAAAGFYAKVAGVAAVGSIALGRAAQAIDIDDDERDSPRRSDFIDRQSSLITNNNLGPQQPQTIIEVRFDEGSIVVSGEGDSTNTAREVVKQIQEFIKDNRLTNALIERR